MSAPWLTIIGLGEDGRDGLSTAAKAALEQAELVVGGARHLVLAGPLRGRTLAWPSPIEDAFDEIFAMRGHPVVVLASGDPMFYGIGSVLAARLEQEKLTPSEMQVWPQSSSMSLAAARLGWALQDCAVVSLHGRALEKIIPHLQPGRRILALSWDAATPLALATLLRARAMANTRMSILERLGGAHERITHTNALDHDLSGIDALNIVALEVRLDDSARSIPLSPGLPDDWFEHDGQITKRDSRAMTLGALSPLHGELLWDIGAGSGSVGIEWMLRGESLGTIAIEKSAKRAATIKTNALALGVPDLQIVQGAAPDALLGLRRPDAVFIGGGATIAGVFEAAWAALKPNGRMVINAVTLETQAQLTALFKTYGGRLTQLNFAEADAVGGFHGWRASMPVVMWRVVKPRTASPHNGGEEAA